MAYSTVLTDNVNNAVFYTCVQDGSGSEPILILVSRTPQANNDAFVAAAQSYAQTNGFSPLIPLNYSSAVNLNDLPNGLIPIYSYPVDETLTCGEP